MPLTPKGEQKKELFYVERDNKAGFAITYHVLNNQAAIINRET
jgi:hypothetical protein